MQLTDNQWLLIERHIPPALWGGRPRKTCMRATFEAILDVLASGGPWHSLSRRVGAPPWQTCYRYFVQWRRSGVLRRLMEDLVQQVRKRENRTASTIIIDSQSVSTGRAGGERRGYDGGKRVKGRKRHLAVCSLGLPRAILVTAANRHDSKAGKTLIKRIGKQRREPPNAVYVDKGYQGRPFLMTVKYRLSCKTRVVIGENRTRMANDGKFKPEKQRWVIERTFGWLCNYNRLNKFDYERRACNSLAMIQLAFVLIALRRLTKPLLS